MAAAGDTGAYDAKPRHAAGAVARARRQRRIAPVTETILWEALRRLKSNVRRQVPLGRYVADFAHHAARLVIEVDSGWHDLPDLQLRDAERDAWMTAQGYFVLRVRSRDVMDDVDAVAVKIADLIRERTGKALPLDGGGLGGGVRATLRGETREAPPAPAADASAATPPSPTLPPSRGKGGQSQASSDFVPFSSKAELK